MVVPQSFCCYCCCLFVLFLFFTSFYAFRRPKVRVGLKEPCSQLTYNGSKRSSFAYNLSAYRQNLRHFLDSVCSGEESDDKGVVGEEELDLLFSLKQPNITLRDQFALVHMVHSVTMQWQILG